MVSDSTGRAPMEPRNSELRPQNPTGRLKPVICVEQTDQFSAFSRVPHNQSAATISPPVVEPLSVTTEPIEKIGLENYLAPVETQTDVAKLASDGGQAEASSESSQSRRRRSSSGRSSADQRWNDIGVDGLPIRRPSRSKSESDEGECEVEGTRLRDVMGLVLALGISLILTQVGLWWGAGIDPLGLWPYVSGWFPNLAPTNIAQ